MIIVDSIIISYSICLFNILVSKDGFVEVAVTARGEEPKEVAFLADTVRPAEA